MCEIVSAATMAGVFGEGAAALTVMDVVGVAAAGLSAVGSYQQSQAQQKMYEHQASVNNTNRLRAERDAQERERAGVVEANRYRSSLRRAQADQMVSMVGEGADIGFGSNIDLLADTAELGERDALTIQYNADRDAHSIRQQGSDYGAQSSMNMAAAKSQSPGLSAAGSLLEGAGTVAYRWNRKK